MPARDATGQAPDGASSLPVEYPAGPLSAKHAQQPNMLPKVSSDVPAVVPGTSSHEAPQPAATRPNSVPGPLKPFAAIFLILWKAAVFVARILGVVLLFFVKAMYRLVLRTSPLLTRAGLKYLEWTLLGWVKKVERWLRWADWVLGWLPKGAKKDDAP